MLNLNSITTDDIKSIDFDATVNNVTLYQHYYVQEPGINHYRLLAYISSKLSKNSLVYDVGTFHGTSAYALAFNPDIHVVSYDVQQNDIGLEQIPPNLQFKLGDVKNDLHILNADIIMIDTAHEGTWELEFYNWLVSHDYHGITLWDDTQSPMFPGMQTNFLQHVTHEVIDLTHIGHITGTTAIIL